MSSSRTRPGLGAKPLNFQQFSDHYTKPQGQLVWQTLVSDHLTPVSIMTAIGPKSWCCLLESVEGGSHRGRYSAIGLEPDVIWRYRDQRAQINRTANQNIDAFISCSTDPMTALRHLIQETQNLAPHPLPPIAAGLFGYLSYDTVRLIEHLPNNLTHVLKAPDGLLMRPGIIIVFDNVEDMIFLVTPVWPVDSKCAKEAFDQAHERLGLWADRITKSKALNAIRLDQADDQNPLKAMVSNTDHDDYCAMVKKAQQYIKAGDIFQVVLSQRFSMPFTKDPFQLYRSLRRLNPSPFLFFFRFDHFSMVGSSPEIIVRLRNNKICIRPIAGTRPRGLDEAEDRALRCDLLSDPKELAEHLMLLDLGRNDVGRVAKAGSIAVTAQWQVEFYSHVMHLVSNVEGILSCDKDSLDALMAGFPAGTVSGAPKIRAMEIIDELEKDRRSIYAGSVGYFSATGDMDMCIAMRTAVIEDSIMHVQAGGGIVADSVPENEFLESCNKARALFHAAHQADLYDPL